MSSIHSVVLNEDVSILATLLNNGLNPDELDDHGQTALFLAARNDHFDAVVLLVEHGASTEKQYNPMAPLYIASSYGHSNIVKFFLESGVSPNQKTDGGYTPLHIAAHRGYPDVVKNLLEHGAHFDGKDKHGNTPLHVACLGGNVEVIKALLEKNNNLCGEKNNVGRTPLHNAAHYGHLDAIKILLEFNASLDEKDLSGYTPLDLAKITKEQNVIEYLSSYQELPS